MKSYYERAMSLSIYWKNRANDFYAAAIVISEAKSNRSTKSVKEKLGISYDLEIALSPVFGFICATSLELSLKACFIEKIFQEKLVDNLRGAGRKSITDDEVYLELDKNFFTHDLCDLAKKVNLKLSHKEENFLKLLTHQIYWQGKYPAPKNVKISEEYSIFFNDVMFEPKKETNTKLRARKFDADMIISWDNFEKMWLKIESFYNLISIT